MQQVTISLEVDSKGAIVGVRAVGSEFKALAQDAQNAAQTLERSIQKAMAAPPLRSSNRFREVEESVQRLGAPPVRQVFRRFQDDVDEMPRHAGRAANLLTGIFGVQLPRAFDAFLNRSKLIGPVLGASFGVIAAFAAAKILISLNDDVGKLIDKLYDWDGANAAIIASTKRMNAGLLEQQKKLDELNKQLELVGLKGSARFAKQSEQETRGLEALINRRKDLLGELAGLRKVPEVPTAVGFGATEEKMTFKQAQARIQEITEELSLLIGAIRISQKESSILGAQFTEAFSDEKREKVKKMWQEVARGARPNVSGLPSNEDPFLRAQREIAEAQSGANLPPDLGPATELLKQADANAREMARIFGDFSKSEAAALRDYMQQLEMQWRQSVRSMASELRQFARDPIAYLKEQFAQFFSELVAGWILTLRGIQGGQMPGGRGIFGSIFGSIFGGIFGGGGGFGLPGATGPVAQNFSLRNLFGLFGFGGGSSAPAGGIPAGGIDPLGILRGLPLGRGFGAAAPAGGGLLAAFGGPAGVALVGALLVPSLVGFFEQRSEQRKAARQSITAKDLNAGALLAQVNARSLSTLDASRQIEEAYEQVLSSPGFRSLNFQSRISFARRNAEQLDRIRQLNIGRRKRQEQFAKVAQMPSEFGDPNFRVEIAAGAIVINSNQPPAEIARAVVKEINRLALDRGKPRIV